MLSDLARQGEELRAFPKPEDVARRVTLIQAYWLRGHEGMGTFSVRLQMGDPSGHRFETIDAIVDSGATYTVLPASLLERLNVHAHATRYFVLADGIRVERRFSVAPP